MAPRGCRRIVLAAAFARATRRYWLSVFPRAQIERNAWRSRADRIPDRELRDTALDALRTKSADLEGAVAFAVFTPPPLRERVVRAIAAFEIAFDYLDSVVELPNRDPIANGRSLNDALLVAVSPGARHPDYYRNHPRREDAGYLEGLVRACQAAVGSLPSFAAVAEPVHRAVSRIVAYQSLNHGDGNGSYHAFGEWARSQAMRGTDLRWWETGAAAGSQLSVLALIAAAGDPAMGPERAAALECSYFPWIGALSTLLDSVIDRHMDGIDGQRNPIDNYASPEETAERLRTIAQEALRAIRSLSDADDHVLLLAAMAAFFHSTPQASAPDVRLATRAVFDAMDGWAAPALVFFRVRRALTRSHPAILYKGYTTATASS